MNSNVITPTSVEEECKKSGIKMEDIKKLRQWLDTQPHLASEHITDLDLILAYHACYQSAEVSKQLVDLHYTLRTLFTNFFKDRSLDDRIFKTLDVVLAMSLKTPGYDNSFVSYHRLIDYDAKKFVLADILRAVMMILDLWQYEYGTWPGFSIIIDLEGVTLSHVAKLDIIVVQQFLYYLQEGLFVRLKELHFINAPSFMDKLLMVLKPFMKKELLNSLTIHQTGAVTLNKYIPIEALPKEAGGQYKSYKEVKEETLAKLKANEDYFVMENKKRVVESLRPGKPKSITDIFGGIEGSFKKLDID